MKIKKCVYERMIRATERLEILDKLRQADIIDRKILDAILEGDREVTVDNLEFLDMAQPDDDADPFIIPGIKGDR